MKFKKLSAAAVSLILAGSNAFAINIPVSGSVSKVMTALVTPTGGVQEFFADLKTVVGNNPAASVTWSGVTASMNQYGVANQYIEVTVNITTAISWRMLLHTNNTGYTGDKSLGSYGLVGANPAQGLPLAWKASDGLLSPPDVPVFSTTRPLPATPEGFTDFMWKFVVDKTQTGTYAYVATDTYVRVWDNSGFYWNEGVGPDMDPVTIGNQPCPAPSLDDKIYVYLAAGFHNSLAQAYSTTSLTVEVIVL